MAGSEQEGKKAELLSRVHRLRELIDEDAPALLISAALDEVARSLEGYTRPGRAEPGSGIPAGEGEPPPDL